MLSKLDPYHLIVTKLLKIQTEAKINIFKRCIKNL